MVGFIAAAHVLALALIPWPMQHYITKLDSTFFLADVVAVLLLVAVFAWLHDKLTGEQAFASIDASRPQASNSTTYSLQSPPSSGFSVDLSSTDQFKQPRSSSATRYVTTGIIVVVTMAMFFQFEFDNTTEVTPDHSGGIMESAMIAAAVAAIATFVLTIRIKFKKDYPPWLSALILSLVAALWLGLITMFTVDRVFQYLDFPRSEVVQSVAYLPIERAYRTGDRAIDYNIQLAGPFANLDVDARDFATAFNDADDVDPVGYCLRATIQRAGAAMRIMHSSTRPFPAGSVVKCPTQRMQ